MSENVVQLHPVVPVAETRGVLPRLALVDAPEVMSPETLSRVLDGVSVATLAEWRTGKLEARRGPAFSKLGGLVRYMKCDVVEWLERSRVATSDQA